MILLCLDRSWSECFIKGVTHLLMYAFICKCLTNRSFRKPLLLVFTRLITWSKSSSQQCGDAASQQLPNGCWKWQGRRQPLPCPHSQRLMGSFISPWPVFCLFAPLLLWKWIAPVKWRNHALKKTHPYNTTEAYLFHLKGEVWGHPPVLPQWHFPTWHSVTFPVKYCWYSCSGIKSMSKRDTSIKALSLPLYLPPPPLTPSFHLCLFTLNTLFPSSSCSNTGLHALPTKCGWLASPGIRRSLFNPKGLPKILSPRICRRQT